MKDKYYLIWWDKLTTEQQNDYTRMVIGEKRSYKDLFSFEIKKIYDYNFK